MKKKITRAILLAGAGLIVLTVLGYIDYHRVASMKQPIFAVKVLNDLESGRRGYVGLGYTASFHDETKSETTSGDRTKTYHYWGAEYDHWILPLKIDFRGHSLLRD